MRVVSAFFEDPQCPLSPGRDRCPSKGDGHMVVVTRMNNEHGRFYRVEHGTESATPGREPQEGGQRPRRALAASLAPLDRA
jgi:hypothetical protein